MPSGTVAESTRRRPLAALLLSLLTTGLGHVYCGRFGKGLVLLFIGNVLGLLGPLAFFPVTSWLRTVAAVGGVVSVVVWIYALADAARTARRIGADYVLRDYNRWYVYVIFVLLSLPLAIGSALFVRRGILQAFSIPTHSMHPTVQLGDRVLANKLAYHDGPVQRGDIVVFIHPNRRHQKQIKRVIALPGDTIEITGGALYVNDKALQRTRVGASDGGEDTMLAGEIFRETNASATYQVLMTAPPGTNSTDEERRKLWNLDKTTVPNGHIFVLGDNRSQARDSRQYGPVPMRDIIGRVDHIYYPRWVSLRPGAGG